MRRNPYARRIAAEGLVVQVGRGRPKRLLESGGTTPRSVRFPEEICSHGPISALGAEWSVGARGAARRGGLRQHTTGPEVNREHAMILFSPDERSTFTDASYHLPAFYELWARWGPEEDRAFWTRAAKVSRDYFVKGADPKTGLTSNLGAFDGTPMGYFGGRWPAAFREDAWRVAMNWSVDWSWWAKDPRERELSDRLQAFFESKGLDTYGDNYKLDGTLMRDRHSPGLVATNGVASLAAADKKRARRFVDALWKLEVPASDTFRYYDGLLYMMSLMHASGRFQIILPQKRSAPATE